MFGKGVYGVETASAFLASLLLGPAGGVLAVLDCGNVISVHSNSADSALEVVLAVIDCGNIISVHSSSADSAMEFVSSVCLLKVISVHFCK
jgi:hypothetical protein